LFVVRSTYGNRYGPTIAVGMRSFFLFVSPPYTWRAALAPLRRRWRRTSRGQSSRPATGKTDSDEEERAPSQRGIGFDLRRRERERERERDGASRVSKRAGENGRSEERTDASDVLEGEERSAPPLRRGERITGRDWVNGEVRV